MATPGAPWWEWIMNPGGAATQDTAHFITGGWDTVHHFEHAAQAAGDAGKAAMLAVSFLANPQNWLRVAEALAGAVLILVGVLIMARNTSTGQAVAERASGAASMAAAVA